MLAVAPEYSAIPGCCWKIWMINEDQKEAGGIYLFESAAALEKYLGSSQLAAVVNNPAFNNFNINTSVVLEAVSVITGAPLMKMSV